MLQDQKVTAKWTYDLILKHIENENSSDILTDILLHKIPKLIEDYFPCELFVELYASIFELILNKLIPKLK